MGDSNFKWERGPLPANTWGWGTVVPVDMDGSGFYFADFCGDSVKIVGSDPKRVLQPREVKYYNNSIALPPKDD